MILPDESGVLFEEDEIMTLRELWAAIGQIVDEHPELLDEHVMMSQKEEIPDALTVVSKVELSGSTVFIDLD